MAFYSKGQTESLNVLDSPRPSIKNEGVEKKNEKISNVFPKRFSEN